MQVGYGDIYPSTTRVERIFATFYLLVNAIFLGYVGGNIAALLILRGQRTSVRREKFATLHTYIALSRCASLQDKHSFQSVYTSFGQTAPFHVRRLRPFETFVESCSAIVDRACMPTRCLAPPARASAPASLNALDIAPMKCNSVLICLRFVLACGQDTRVG
jgi:hypothetical protein